MGIPWAAHGQPVGRPRAVREHSTGSHWAVHRLPMGIPRIVHGHPMGSSCAANGQPTDCPWALHGQSTGIPWAAHFLHMHSCPWAAHGVPMVCPWCAHGMPMVCPRAVQRINVLRTIPFLFVFFKLIMVTFSFLRVFGSVIYPWEKEKKGMAFQKLVGTKGKLCHKIASKHVLLSGAYPINRSGSALAGPAPLHLSVIPIHSSLRARLAGGTAHYAKLLVYNNSSKCYFSCFHVVTLHPPAGRCTGQNEPNLRLDRSCVTSTG